MEKKIIFAALLAVLVGMFGSQQRSSVQTTLTIGETKIAVEIADTETKRARGLSGRAALAENSGMLFVFDEPGQYGFWMKEMNFPIDIVWIEENWRVIDMTEKEQFDHKIESGQRPNSRYRYNLVSEFKIENRLEGPLAAD